MMIKNILAERNMTIYRLAKTCDIPYATCNDIVNGKAQLEKCSAETVYKIARALNTSVETLLAPYLMKRSSFENFKSAICHRLKELGDIDFIMDVLESGDIRTYYDCEWFPESLYLLAMLDYISRENNIPLCEEYDDIRQYSLEKPIYPTSILAMSLASGSRTPLEDAANNSIPEFRRFNIIENEVRNVI